MTKAEKTKAYIIEKAADIFNTKGVAATSLSDLTDATGLTKGSIYGNFSCKDEVALAAFDHNFDKVKSIIGAEIQQQETYRDKLLVYVRIYNNFDKYPFPVGGCPVLNTSVEADHTHPSLRQKAIDAIEWWKKTLMQIIKKGIEQGEFHEDIDIEQTALTVIALVEGSIMVGNVTNRNAYRKQIMKSLETIIQAL